MIRVDADGVVFDFGGVITASAMMRWPETLYPYCERFGLRADAVRDGFSRYRNLWDGGEISFDDMYRRIFADAGLAEPSPEMLVKIWQYDAESWIGRKRPETLALMRELKAKGRRIGILTNMSADFWERLFVPNCGEYRALADVEVVSGLERCCKPSPEIYGICRSRMDLPAHRLLFLDDTVRNVEAARECGWQAEVYPPESSQWEIV